MPTGPLTTIIECDSSSGNVDATARPAELIPRGAINLKHVGNATGNTGRKFLRQIWP